MKINYQNVLNKKKFTNLNRLIYCHVMVCSYYIFLLLSCIEITN